MPFKPAAILMTATAHSGCVLMSLGHAHLNRGEYFKDQLSGA